MNNQGKKHIKYAYLERC